VSPEHAERAAYVAEGEAAIGQDVLAVGDLAVLASGQPVEIVAGRAGAKVMLCGGAPMDGPRHIWWNFVSSSKERIEQAKADWRDGRFGKVPGDPEFIPLPEK
jgi:redox-sensitive bicupin YhaK (pirin superfamily)